MSDSRREGFTLLELIIVLLILSVATTVVWTRLPRTSAAERSEGLLRLALANEALHEHAAFKKKA